MEHDCVDAIFYLALKISSNHRNHRNNNNNNDLFVILLYLDVAGSWESLFRYHSLYIYLSLKIEIENPSDKAEIIQQSNYKSINRTIPNKILHYNILMISIK